MKWEYQYSGNEFARLMGAPSTVTISNMPGRPLNGTSVVPQRLDRFGTTEFTFIETTPQGIAEFAEQGPQDPEPRPFSPPRYILKLPIEPNATWTSALDFRAEGIRTVIDIVVRVVSVDATVTVPAGTFQKCVETDGVGSKEVSYFFGRHHLRVERQSWYCPNVGLVKDVFAHSGVPGLDNHPQVLQLVSKSD